MGRDAEDWTILDAQANRPVVGGIGWARQIPAGHEFAELPWKVWDELANLAYAGDLERFESLLSEHKEAWQMYLKATSPDRVAIRAAFSVVRRR